MMKHGLVLINALRNKPNSSHIGYVPILNDDTQEYLTNRYGISTEPNDIECNDFTVHFFWDTQMWYVKTEERR